ncbi:MAG: hypothetical protein VCC04_16785, partial [Myxococcota bacterium]
FIAIGEGEQLTLARRMAPNSLVDIAGGLAHAMGLAWKPDSSGPVPRRIYTDEEEAAVAARLRALGYID